MYTSLEINNFKGIKSGKLEKLSQINILIGRNNSGKSTVLDALLLMRTSIASEDFLDREGLVQLVSRKVTGGTQAANYAQLWFRLDTSHAIEINANLESELAIQGAWTFQHEGNRPRSLVKIVSQRDGSTKHEWNSRGNANSTKNIQSADIWNVLMQVLDETTANFLSMTHMIEPNLIYQGFDEGFWFELAKDRKDKYVVTMVNEIYGTNIENLNFGLFPPPERRLIAALPETSISADWYGDGLRYAVNILSLGVVLHGCVVLVEELESHQHPESMRMLVDTLFKLAKQRELQLFITSHSMEMISYALASARRAELDLVLHHVQLDQEGLFRSTPLSQPNAEMMLDIGHDPRFHDKYIKSI